MMTLMMISLIRSRKVKAVGIRLGTSMEMRSFPVISLRILEAGLEEAVALEVLEADLEED